MLTLLSFFWFLGFFFVFASGRYLLCREWWCRAIFLLSSSLSENKCENVQCVLLWIGWMMGWGMGGGLCLGGCSSRRS